MEKTDIPRVQFKVSQKRIHLHRVLGDSSLMFNRFRLKLFSKFDPPRDGSTLFSDVLKIDRTAAIDDELEQCASLSFNTAVDDNSVGSYGFLSL